MPLRCRIDRWFNHFAFGFPIVVLVICLLIEPASAKDIERAAQGYENLRTHPYLPPDFDDDVFSSLWTVWPEPDRSAAAAADADQRRRMTFQYYGLIEAEDNSSGTVAPLGYMIDKQGKWVMNCLACHGGKVAGKTIPGLPNSHIALQTLTEDVRAVKIKLGKTLSHLDAGSLQFPLSTTNGTTNSVVFGIILGSYRNPDMTLGIKRKLPPLIHHDVDAPAFWNVRRKESLYVDGFAPKTARPLMQFILLPHVTPEKLAQWEPEFDAILAWIQSLEPPKYPYQIDRDLAAKGATIFDQNCARCHGTYGPAGQYQQTTISIDEVGTDPVRWKALVPEHRQWMKDGWLSRFGQDHVETNPAGYVAPPLDGVWASGPYFHNGSVPTLWHVLHPDSRPVVWKRTEDGFDQDRIGLEVEVFDQISGAVKVAAHRRRYFDTRLPGKNAQGHRFPDQLDEQQKHAVLEYLKTL